MNVGSMLPFGGPNMHLASFFSSGNPQHLGHSIFPTGLLTLPTATPSATIVNGTRRDGWLRLEVCREYQRKKCSRSAEECKYAHPPSHVDQEDGFVVCCYDSLKNNCKRSQPPCKFLHPPEHLKTQLLERGKQNLQARNGGRPINLLQHLPMFSANQHPNAHLLSFPVLPYLGSNTNNTPTALYHPGYTYPYVVNQTPITSASHTASQLGNIAFITQPRHAHSAKLYSSVNHQQHPHLNNGISQAGVPSADESNCYASAGQSSPATPSSTNSTSVPQSAPVMLHANCHISAVKKEPLSTKQSESGSFLLAVASANNSLNNVNLNADAIKTAQCTPSTNLNQATSPPTVSMAASLAAVQQHQQQAAMAQHIVAAVAHHNNIFVMAHAPSHGLPHTQHSHPHLTCSLTGLLPTASAAAAPMTAQQQTSNGSVGGAHTHHPQSTTFNPCENSVFLS